MFFYAVVILLNIQYGSCDLWPKGVVHYAISKTDYDIHSQDIIKDTFAEIEREICVKFFNAPSNYNTSLLPKILYISNPDKKKSCPPDTYNFNNSVIDMAIGYKCIDSKSIARIVTDMLRASIETEAPTINSYDLMRSFQKQDEDPSKPFLLSPTDRNFINAHYHVECGTLARRRTFETRRNLSKFVMTQKNMDYYKSKLWPLGVVMYGIDDDLRNTKYHVQLKFAMTTIELSSCIIFQELNGDEVLQPKNLLWFCSDGETVPELGFQEGKQTISLPSMIDGAPGHKAHTLNMLLRALGVNMVSNRPDRDSYVTINWKYVEKGKEHFLETYPTEAWLIDDKLPYDFDSATHAPANFVCSSCKLGEATVTPAQDHLWQRTLSMGRRASLSAGDIEMLSILYIDTCQNRHMEAS